MEKRYNFRHLLILLQLRIKLKNKHIIINAHINIKMCV